MNSPSVFRLGLLVFLLLTANVCAQSAATSAQASPTIAPGTNSYAYLGCYNETTGDADAGNVRALGELGNLTADDAMTVQNCLSICNSMNKPFAGLEYSRECWCAVGLNSNAAKLPDANCSLPCAGDATAVCGGPLKLTVYQRSKMASAAGKLEIGWGVVIALIIGLVVAAVLMA